MTSMHEPITDLAMATATHCIAVTGSSDADGWLRDATATTVMCSPFLTEPQVYSATGPTVDDATRTLQSTIEALADQDGNEAPLTRALFELGRARGWPRPVVQRGNHEVVLRLALDGGPVVASGQGSNENDACEAAANVMWIELARMGYFRVGS